MVALPNVANVVQVVLKGTKNAYPWSNKLHLQYSGTAPGTTELTSVGTAVANAWNTDLASLCGASVELTEVDLADLTARTAATQTVTVSHLGTRAGTDVPNSVALVLSWKINRRYRGGHPRTYLPAGMVADISTGRLWTSGIIASAVSGGAAFLAALNAITSTGATYRMVSVSYFQNKLLLSVPEPFTVQTCVVHGRVDTIRHRLGKEVA